jgi:colanic acid biosynthesis glycosyl transferase WcaI
VKILIVNQFFWPDVAATGQFVSDLTRHLGREHDITVICSGGSYAKTESTDDPPPAKIIRIPGFSYNRSALGRLLSYTTFFLGALWHEFRVPRQDLIVTMTTPPMLAIGGALVKILRGTRHYIWEMDVFPDAFVSLGVFRERALLTRLLGWIENTCRLRADGIMALGPCMRERLIARGIPKHLVHVAENWADGNMISFRPLRKSGPINILYSGNLGLSHDVDTIADVMRHYRDDSRFVFTFIGGGIKRGELERRCKAEKLTNARFLPYAKRENVDEHFAQADIGLVTERPAHIGIVVPSKVYGLLAAGRPVLFIGPRRSTADLLIRRFRCGWQIDPGDRTSVVELLEWLSANRGEIQVRGQRARQAFDRHYDLPHGVARIAAALALPKLKYEVPDPGQNDCQAVIEKPANSRPVLSP